MKLVISICVLILLGIILFSCKKKQGLSSSLAESETVQSSEADMEDVTQNAVDTAIDAAEKAVEQAVEQPIVKMGYEASTDPFTIKTARIEGEMLIIEVSYSGGCKEHDFQLFTDGMLMKSLPPKQTYFLKHAANADFCKKMVHDTLRYDLSGISAGNAKELKIILAGYKEEMILKLN